MRLTGSAFSCCRNVPEAATVVVVAVVVAAPWQLSRVGAAGITDRVRCRSMGGVVGLRPPLPFVASMSSNRMETGPADTGVVAGELRLRARI